MNYTEAVDYIETIPKFTVKHPPEHTRELLSRLGNPQEGIKIIHVAGTNGKGSVCAYMQAILLLRESVSDFYITTSGEAQRADPDQWKRY